MKEFSTRNGIPTEYFYQLLEWKDKTRPYWLIKAFGTNSLNELTEHQLKALYLIAFREDMPQPKNK